MLYDSNMKSALINVLAGVLAALPLRLNHKLGAAIGWTAWKSKSKLRTITEINLDLCFPEWSEAEKQHVCKASLIETGKALTESFWLWKRPPEQVLRLVKVVEGQHLVDKARQSDGGFLVATPHLGSWEVCSLPLSSESPVTCLYLPPKQAALEQLTIDGRINMGSDPIKIDSVGIKHLLQTLKAGGTIGLLPDQEPDKENGCFAPFFAQTANTMTLLAKFAARAKNNTLFCFAKRMPQGSGWEIYYLPAAENIDSRDKAVAAAALNTSVEQCILRCPEQYIWNYKRFRIKPDGTRRDYKRRPKS